MEDFFQNQFDGIKTADIFQNEQQTAEPDHYKSTGKVNLLRFIPLVILAMGVTFLMSIGLVIADMYYYLFIIMPLIIALPVLGMVYVVVSAGRCRNKIIAVLIGLGLMSQYYLGFWGMGYVAFIGYYGYEDGTQVLVEQTGASGVWGYFLHHCKGNVIESTSAPNLKDKQPDAFDKYSSYVFYALELIMLVAIAYSCSRNLATRVFYEKQKRWAKKKIVRFLPADFEKLLTVMNSQEWAQLEQMTKLGKFGNHQTQYGEIVIEYCKGQVQEPVYLSVKGRGLEKITNTLGLKGRGILEKTYVRQKRIPGSSIYDIDRALELKILPPNNSSLQQSDDRHINTISSIDFNATTSFASSAEAQTVTKTKQEDFRRAASEESLKLIGAMNADTLSMANVCLCMPVDEHSRISVTRIAHFPTVLSILTLIALFAGLGIAAWGGSLQESGTVRIAGFIIIAVGMSMFIASIALLLFSGVLHVQRTKKLLLTRPGALFDKKAPKVFAAALENGRNYHKFKFTPEDAVLIYPDVIGRRILIEGCSHRYVICGGDDVQIESISHATENVALILYNVGSIRLSLAITCTSVKKAFINQTIFGLLKRNRSSNKVADLLRKAIAENKSLRN